MVRHATNRPPFSRLNPDWSYPDRKLGLGREAMNSIKISAQRTMLTLGVLGVAAAGVVALGGQSPVTDAQRPLTDAQAAAVPKHVSGLREAPSSKSGLAAVPNSVRLSLPLAISKPLIVSPLATASGDGAKAQAFADASKICLSVRLSDGAGSTGCGPRAGLDSTTLTAPVVIKDGDGYVVAGLVPDGATSVEVTGKGLKVNAAVTGNVFVASVDEEPTDVFTVSTTGAPGEGSSVTAP